MADAFDPYYRWLGIPPAEQPPHFYALLGVAKYEADAEVIRNAAFQRLTFLKVLMSGSQSALAEKLNAEVIEAKQTLLDPERRNAYAERLRNAEVAIAPELARATLSPSSVSDNAAGPVVVAGSSNTLRRKRGVSPALQLLGVVGGGAIGVALGLVVLRYGFDTDPLGAFPPSTATVAQNSSQRDDVETTETPLPSHGGNEGTEPATEVPREKPGESTSTPAESSARVSPMQGASVRVAGMREVACGVDPRLPRELTGATTFEWIAPTLANEAHATLRFEVLDAGTLYLAAHWRDEGSDGPWQGERQSRQQLLAAGWEDVGDARRESPSGEPYVFFRRRFAAGDRTRFAPTSIGRRGCSCRSGRRRPS